MLVPNIVNITYGRGVGYSFEEETFDKSITEIKGEILVISQFTLISNIQKGNRPSFKNACDYEKAKILYNQFIKLLNSYEINVEKGRFGAHMNLDFINDGPVTIIMDDRNE